jgi:hypothetical protein
MHKMLDESTLVSERAIQLLIEWVQHASIFACNVAIWCVHLWISVQLMQATHPICGAAVRECFFNHESLLEYLWSHSDPCHKLGTTAEDQTSKKFAGFEFSGGDDEEDDDEQIELSENEFEEDDGDDVKSDTNVNALDDDAVDIDFEDLAEIDTFVHLNDNASQRASNILDFVFKLAAAVDSVAFQQMASAWDSLLMSSRSSSASTSSAASSSASASAAAAPSSPLLFMARIINRPFEWLKTPGAAQNDPLLTMVMMELLSPVLERKLFITHIFDNIAIN